MLKLFLGVALTKNMDETMKDHQRLYAAATRSRGHFCVSIFERGDEDPYSFIFVYDDAYPQPWARIDVPRVINDLIDAKHQAAVPIFVALSNEGDVYFLENDGPRREKIPGAGLFSDDAKYSGKLLGRLRCIDEIGGLIHVAGASSQFYRRGYDGEWSNLGLDTLKPDEGFNDIFLSPIAGNDLNSVFVAGVTARKQRQLTQKDKEDLINAEIVGDLKRYNEIYDSKKDPNLEYTNQGRFYHFDGTNWVIAAVTRAQKFSNGSSPSSIADIFIETPDRVWAVGHNGVIMVGNARDGFKDVSFKGDDENLLSITKFRDRYVIASDNALHWFNGHNLSPLRPTTISGVATPLKVQAVNDVLYYFDYRQGIHRFDGENWQQIPIPPELLERDFRGLTPP